MPDLICNLIFTETDWVFKSIPTSWSWKKEVNWGAISQGFSLYLDMLQDFSKCTTILLCIFFLKWFLYDCLTLQIEMITPKEYIGPLMELAQERRGEFKEMKFITEIRASLTYSLPLAEVLLFDYLVHFWHWIRYVVIFSRIFYLAWVIHIESRSLYLYIKKKLHTDEIPDVGQKFITNRI